jgi:uncharacterized iron-regulated membrane protein
MISSTYLTLLLISSYMLYKKKRTYAKRKRSRHLPKTAKGTLLIMLLQCVRVV